MSTPTTDLSLDDRSDAIKFSYPFLALFSTIFVTLRIWNNIKIKKQGYANLSDWLLALAQICALIGTTFSYLSGWVGAGKHAWNPSITKQDFANYLKYLWFSQYFNLTAMAALKFSICAFMLQLSFSKTYRVLIWLTVVIHTALNVTFPYINLFGECDPIAKHWDSTLPGYCWSAKPRTISGYLGAASNIVSDLFYTFAPLNYIAKVQLSTRAKWGVRTVFLLGLIATTISAVKLYEIKALNESNDLTYESINLSILSVTEVFVGTLTASLPPLRLLFENLLNKILSESAMRTRGRSHMNDYILSDYVSNMNTRRMKREDPECDDNSSEKMILPDTKGSKIDNVQGRAGNIIRTTHISLTMVETKSHSNFGAEG